MVDEIWVCGSGGEGDVVVFEGPFLHVANLGGTEDVDDELGIVDGAEVAAEKRVGFPNFFKEWTIVEDFRLAGDADLVVIGVEIAEFDFGVGGNLAGFVIVFQVSHIDGKAVDADGGNRAEAGLIAVDGGEHGELGGLHGGAGKVRELVGIDGIGSWSGHGVGGWRGRLFF